MKTRLFTLLLLATLARADVLPPAQDTSSFKGKLTPITGKANTLALTDTRLAYVQFDLTTLPAGVLATEIASARLRVYFTKVTKAAAINCYEATSAWNEKTPMAPPSHALFAFDEIPQFKVVGKNFAEVDVTATVRQWQAGTLPNNGFVLAGLAGINALLGAKEGSASGYPCELEVEIARGFTIAEGSITATQLADGTISPQKLATGAAVANLADGTVALAKLANSTFSVTAGSGLTGGGSVPLGGNVTLSLGSTIPRLDLSNTFTGHLFVGSTFYTPNRGNNTGASNLFLGDAGFYNTTGNSNIFMGDRAGNDNVSGSSNTAIGVYALNESVAGNFNLALGESALRVSTSSRNTAIGVGALGHVTAGSDNIGLGYQAGLDLTTGSNNIVIGHPGVAGDANIIRLGDGTTQTDTYLTGIIHGNGSGLTNLPASPNGWQLGGNAGTTAGTQFLGTTDNQPLEFKVNGQRALRLEYADKGLGASVNVIGGFGGNVVAGLIIGATIGGGGTAESINEVTNDFGTVSGGKANTAAAVATISGGFQNTAVGSYSMIPGGLHNTAAGRASFAAGSQAKANHTGAFCWADANPLSGDLTSAADNQFNVRASGGYRLFSNGALSAGVSLAPDGNSWATISDQNAKKNFAPVDGAAVLDRLAAVPVQRWNYKSEPDAAVPHLGPMAQAFKAAFYPGRDDKVITTLEFDGVELAAIQGLHQKLKEKDAEIAALKQQLAAQAARDRAIEARLTRLEQQAPTAAPVKAMLAK